MPSFDLETLEYNSLTQILLRFIDSPAGAQWTQSLSPLAHKNEIKKQFQVITECLRLLDMGLGFRFTDLGDDSIIFEKLAITGAAHDPKEILQIISLSSSGESTKKALHVHALDAPGLAELGKRMPGLDPLLFSLKGKITPTGEIEDNASPELKRVRNEIAILRNRLYQALDRILKRHDSSRTIQDEVITIRNERFVIPVRVENRKDLPGVVHGTSSSGATVFLEPLEILELNNHLVRLRERAEEEIRNILLNLTQKIRENLRELQDTSGFLGYLDFSFAKARFSQKYRCVIPEINEEGILSYTDGRHPTLELTLKSQGMEIIPISVELDSTRHILVISGPNTGGKTVALKTVGLLTLMALSGIPVPALAANVSVFGQVFADIGDRQSIAENLSTFSSHLLNIKEILEKVSSPALVLLDELGTGTDPAEGSALGVAIVESLRGKGVTAVVTTHHNGMKMYASTTPRVTNASVEFDEATLRPTFRLIDGVPGNSSGIEMARKLGLDSSIISHARDLISNEEVQITQFSRHLRDQIEKTSKLRSRLESEYRSLESKHRALEEKYRSLEDRKKMEIEQVRQSAFESFDQESRKLVAEIRDKYLSVRARRELEKKASKLREHVNQKLAAITESQNDRTLSGISSKPLDSGQDINVGAKVMVKRFGQEGTVIAAHSDGQWEVTVGNFKCVANAAELVPFGAEANLVEKPLSSASRIMVQMSSPELSSNEINLIGCTVDEAIDRVDKFLDSAFLASIPTVRLIHGSGMGKLRKALSAWLSEQPYVEKFSTANPNEGGNGVTVVSLKR